MTEQIAPELQIKTFDLSYPDFCLFLQALSSEMARLRSLALQLDAVGAVHLASDARSDIDAFRALYVRLVGEE